jgi:hypothetical protein
MSVAGGVCRTLAGYGYFPRRHKVAESIRHRDLYRAQLPAFEGQDLTILSRH